MKDLSNAFFEPDTIELMTTPMSSAIATLPHPLCRAMGCAFGFALLLAFFDGAAPLNF